MSERTAVYRLYNADEELLYVGVARRPEVRWVQHAADKAWWGEVRSLTISWFPSREAALLEEKRAMRDERPLHNVSNSPWRAAPRTDGKGLEVVPKPKPQPTPVRYIRFSDEDWHDLGAAAKAMGTDRGTLLKALVGWYLRRPNDKLPERPSAEQMAEIVRSRLRNLA